MVTIEEKKTIVTSALPYIHGVPHLGNITGSLLPADIFHRYLDLKGEDNLFICGSDVHGTPLQLEAIEQGVPVEEFKEEQHKKVKNILKEFNLDFSIYSETHSDYNRKQTQEMFVELYVNGYIEESVQTLPYSNEDERFLPDRYIEGECPHCGGLARGDQCDDCGKLLEPEELIEPYSTISNSKDIVFKETKHLFLDLEQFEGQIREWVDQEESPIPDSKREEVKNSLDNLEKRCITRDIDWGFDVPVQATNNKIEEDDADVEKLDPDVYGEKTLYVWFDAPIGYIGFTREYFEDQDDWKEYWCGENSEIYHSIGKDNTIFHSVIWPAILIGSRTEERNYQLPTYEFIQEFLLAEDTKFSKSRGKGLSTEEALEMHHEDYWRFYLSRNLPEGQDTRFKWSEFETEVNNVLNDTIGNFVNRTHSLAEKWFNNQYPSAELTYEDRKKISEAESIVEEYVREMENHNLSNALEKSVELARLGDKYLADEEPWNNEERRAPVIHVSIQIMRALAVTLYPFIPRKAKEIASSLRVEIHEEKGYNEFTDPLVGGLTPEKELGERNILFEKIDVDQSVQQNHNYNEDTVSFEDFQNMDIKTGVVSEVEEHPNADRLFKVQVNIGDATLQTCAGLKKHYQKEELLGKEVTVLANLEPTELRGEKSECMMLAAENDDRVKLLTPEESMDPGSEVK